MAFSMSGIFARICRFSESQLRVPRVPGYYGLVPFVPDTDTQVRDYAARKGTREKAMRKKRAIKLKKAAEMAKQERKKKNTRYIIQNVKKTVPVDLPAPPTQYDVFFSELYKPKQYSITEAVKVFREDLHPNILNKPLTKLEVLVELNAVAEKKNKIISPWKTLVKYPHNFDFGFKRKILVLCKDDLVHKALELGATTAGGVSLIKDIKKGEVEISLYDKIIGQVEIQEEMSTIRSKLKLNYPKFTNGTLVTDVLNAIEIFKHGVEYCCNISQSDETFGWVTALIGTTDLTEDQLEDNFLALLKDINNRRPKRPGDFITYVWMKAPPSKLTFSIHLQPYFDKIDKEKLEEEKKVEEEEKVTATAVAG